MKFDSIMEAADQDRLEVPAGWGQGRATFGGLVAAILIRHMQTKLGEKMAPLRSFSLSFVAPMAPGATDLELIVLRAGKSVTQVQVVARQEEQVVAVMLASLGNSRESKLKVAAPLAPTWKSREESFKVPFMEGLSPDFLRHFDLYYAGGNLPLAGAAEPDFQGYMCFQEPSRYQDFATLACLVDTWPPSVIPMLDRPAPMSSLTWTMEYLVDPASLAPVEYWQYQVHTEAFADGYGQNRAVIWDDQGNPVALSRQSIVVFA